MSCGQPGRWGCPDVDRFQGGSREERMMARRRDRTRRGWVTGWIEDGKRKTDTERPGDAHIDTLARMALQARDCKVVTTEHSAGAIGNRLQLPSSIYANHLSLSLSLSRSLSLLFPFLRLVNCYLVPAYVVRPIGGRVCVLTPPPVAPSFTVRVPAYLAGTKYLTALLPVPLTRVRARN